VPELLLVDMAAELSIGEIVEVRVFASLSYYFGGKRV
jgi:hypothetical protein